MAGMKLMAVTRAAQIHRSAGQVTPAEALPEDVAEMFKSVWDVVIGLINSIVSGGADGAAKDPLKDPTNQPDAKTIHGKKTLDPKYAKVKGTPFIKGTGDKGRVAMNDVSQGYLGDCYFVASLAALAQRNPSAIEKGIRDNGDGTYTVTFPGEGASVVVDGAFPTKNGHPVYAEEGDVSGGDKELWVMLYEKAWAKLKGGYEQIRGSKIHMKSRDAMQAITGKSSTVFRTSSKSKKWVFETIAKAVGKGLPITAGSYPDKHFGKRDLKQMAAKGVHGNHAYAVRGVDEKAGKIKLYNPWGAEYHVDDLTIDEFVKYYQTVHINQK
jgi:hypothetical protein